MPTTPTAQPDDVGAGRERLLRQAAKGPPRLVVHLRLVHDVACELLERLAAGRPGLAVDRLVAAGAPSRWAAFAWLDELLQELAGPAELRLAFHTGFPTS
jgi:hypothetical protein